MGYHHVLINVGLVVGWLSKEKRNYFFDFFTHFLVGNISLVEVLSNFIKL